MAFWFGRFGVLANRCFGRFFLPEGKFPPKKTTKQQGRNKISNLKMGGSWNILDSLKTAQKGLFSGAFVVSYREGSQPVK